MPFVNPPNFVAGAVLTEAQLDILSDNETFLANPPKCRVFHSVAISIPNNMETSLTFNSERFDTDTMHSTVTNPERITITTAGTYLITGHVIWQNNVTGRRVASIWKNGLSGVGVGVGRSESSPAGTGEAGLNPSALVSCVAGDFLLLAAYQNSGVALNVITDQQFSLEFSAIWMSQ